MALTQISTAGVKDDAVTAGKIPANAVGSSEIAADAVTGAKIADNAIDSEHYTDGSIDNAHLADDAVGIAELSATGTASSSTFLRGDNSWTTVNTDLVSDTSPQLGGNLDVNTNNISFGDSSDGSSDDVLKFGAGNDLTIFHNGSASYIKDTGTGNLVISSSLLQITNAGVSENMAKFHENGAVELYYDNSKTAWTTGSGFNIKGGNTSGQSELQIYGNEGQDAEILLAADDGDDNADYWKIISSNDNSFYLQNYTAGSYETNIKATGNGAVELYYDNSKKFETYSNGVKAANNGHIKLASDSGKFFMGAGDDAELFHDGTNLTLNGDGTNATFLRAKSGENSIKLIPDGAVELYHNNSKKFETGVSGEYGSFTATNGANGWSGMSIGGGTVFMGNGTDAGIWNDTDNEWMIKCNRGGATELQYDGSEKFRTTSAGASITGTCAATAFAGDGVLQVRAAYETNGTYSIYDSYGVSSLGDNGTGYSDVNFTTSYGNENYSVTTNGQQDSGGGARFCTFKNPDSSHCEIEFRSHSNSSLDAIRICVQCSGDQP